jgi:DNA replication protein DnaC
MMNRRHHLKPQDSALRAAPSITKEGAAMLNNATAAKLREMKMGVMARSFEKQMRDTGISELSFEERFGIIVDEEYTTRRNNRLKRLMRGASYSIPDASLEDVEYHADRRLEKGFITKLGACDYIGQKRNVIILGATGAGKTYLACALGMTANRNFTTVKYTRVPELLGELAIARVEGNYRKLIKQYRAVQLLILDDWLLSPLKDTEAKDLLEIAEGRYKKGSTIFCSQFDVGGWHEKIGDPTLADAICDRIVHDSYTVFIAGNDSMRKRKGMNQDESKS